MEILRTMPAGSICRRAWWIRCLRVLTLLLILGGVRHAPAQESPAATEYEIKAAFILNFARFAEWPASKFEGSNTPFVIGVLGDDSFEETLKKVVKDKTIAGRKVQVELFRTAPEARKAHLVFITGNDKRRAAQLAGMLAGAKVLTVGQAEDFSEGGGMIGFKTIANRVRFEINTRAAEKENIKISSKLLSLATKIWK